MRIGIGINFYNESSILPSLLKNLAKVENVIFFDGRFYEFPGKSDLSDDGSRELIKEAGRRIVDVGACSIYDKCNVRFQVCGESMDAVLLISCDEYIKGNWKSFCENCELTLPILGHSTYYIPYHDKDGRYPDRDMATRLFYKPKEIYQRSAAHWFYFKGEDRLFANQIIDGIKIIQDSSKRDDKRELMMDVYQMQTTPLEQRRTYLYNDFNRKKKF